MANRGLHLADCFVRTTSDHTVELQAGASRIPRMVEAAGVEPASSASKAKVITVIRRPIKTVLEGTVGAAPTFQLSESCTFAAMLHAIEMNLIVSSERLRAPRYL